jgi:hypothetical protein
MKTAVEWLEDEMLKGKFSMKNIFEQAKEMEKEQICDAFLAGGDIGFYRYKSDENYYNKTYKK